MSRYTWGLDGYGRAHICKDGEWTVLLCMLHSGTGKLGVWMLEGQDNETDA